MELNFESIVFLIFSLITLGGALLVVTTRNLFHGALYLMLSLFGTAGLFALLTAPFLAGVQVVVYIGAIAILIIFAIMLTPQVTRTGPRNTQWIAAVVTAVILFAMLLSVVSPLADELGIDNWNANFKEDNPDPVAVTKLDEFGRSLVDAERYLLPFEVASVLLMAALIGSVMLVQPTLRRRETPPVVDPAIPDQSVASGD